MEDAMKCSRAEGVVKYGLDYGKDWGQAGRHFPDLVTPSRRRHALHAPLFLRRMPTGKKRFPLPDGVGAATDNKPR